MTLQSTYYFIASATGIIATLVNVTLFLRNRPDRVKAAVQSAIAPIAASIVELQSQATQQDAQLEQHGLQLAKIDAEVRHTPQRQDLDAIHHRITDLVRSTSETSALAKIVGEQQSRLSQFLLEGGRRG